MNTYNGNTNGNYNNNYQGNYNNYNENRSIKTVEQFS